MAAGTLEDAHSVRNGEFLSFFCISKVIGKQTASGGVFWGKGVFSTFSQEYFLGGGFQWGCFPGDLLRRGVSSEAVKA